ncbi:MAG: hypothetical protein RIF33_17480 [Cyclobacteriaceae bacterium]
MVKKAAIRRNFLEIICPGYWFLGIGHWPLALHVGLFACTSTQYWNIEMKTGGVFRESENGDPQARHAHLRRRSQG